MARGFNGTSQGVKFERSALLEVPTNIVSVSGWVYRDGAQDQYDRIFDKEYNNANTDPYITYSFEWGLSNAITFSVGVTGTNILVSGGNTAITDKTWTNIIGVYNAPAASPNLKAYINNVQESTTVTDSRSLVYDTSANGPLDIGYRSATGGYMKGALAEFGVWNIALSSDVRAALAKGFSPLFFKTGLVGYFRMIGDGTTETDMKTGLISSVNTASQFPHPRIIYPTRSLNGFPVIVPTGRVFYVPNLDGLGGAGQQNLNPLM